MIIKMKLLTNYSPVLFQLNSQAEILRSCQQCLGLKFKQLMPSRSDSSGHTELVLASGTNFPYQCETQHAQVRTQFLALKNLF